MTNNKAREVNNPIIKQLLDETTPEELAKIDGAMSNNKQQTAVKLYTEEEVVRAIELSDGRSTDEVLAGLTPIQLPSHHEIWEEAIKEELNQRRYDFMRGADFVRDKIQEQ
jgi:Mg/Co/Ni transporter MgtE